MPGGVAFLLALVLATPAAAGDTGFDPPLATQTRTVPPTAERPKATLACRTYAGFMVKVVDEGEVGAAQLSILPIAPGASRPACRRENAADEKVISAKDWDGYFKGVKGDYVLFDAADGVNGALPFAVFSAATGAKLLEDAALGALHRVALDGGTLTLGYRRSVTADCSVPHDGAACWTKLAAANGLAADKAPDCAAGYARARRAMAKDRCEAQGRPVAGCLETELKAYDAQGWDAAPSVVLYEAETVLAPGQPPKVTARGPALACHPSD